MPQLIEWFVEQQETIVHIDCGYDHSHCRSAADHFYLFGSNNYNECATFDGREKVFVPFRINEVVEEKLNAQRIKSLSLGVQNTKIIVYRLRTPTVRRC